MIRGLEARRIDDGPLGARKVWRGAAAALTLAALTILFGEAGFTDTGFIGVALGAQASDSATEVVFGPAAEPPAFRYLDVLVPRGRVPPAAVLAKGKFLVASRHLNDPNFFHTVILLLDYNASGAMGLIINRPTELTLAAMLPQVEELQQRKDTIYVGGPVARHNIVLPIRSTEQPEESGRVFEDIYVSSSIGMLRQLIAKQSSGDKFHAYAGYAGWAPQQLDREVSRGDWYVLRADAKMVFDKPAADVWPELIRRSPGSWARAQ